MDQLSRMQESWRLLCGHELRGEITADDADMPWLHGSFVAGPAFSKVKSLFDRELELLEDLEADPEASYPGRSSLVPLER
ncbi:hypothetical protein [Nonomuraea polychroma]|uniref:hypothetical protein n=1 Tax=Nonomuraea polychroma TaxID=46176 RepID=UPI0019D43460|nr:hypothetical protein [Nonomuraea polychroma]